MDYVSKIFERANLQHIRAFIINDGDCLEFSNESYAERLKSAEKNIFNKVSEKFPDQLECEDFTNNIFAYAAEIEAIYSEIGMKCGAMISIQLLSELLYK